MATSEVALLGVNCVVSSLCKGVSTYSGFEVTCPDCDLQSALDHAARDK